MFSPEQIYDYLRYYCHNNKKNTTVRSFSVNGSKLLMDLAPASTPYLKNNTQYTETHDISNENYRLHTGCLDMYDQEPVSIDAYYQQTIKHMDKNAFRSAFNTHDFVFSASMGIYNPIICHSEQNSNDVQKFINTSFIDLYFWSNAYTSRYWFNHYRPLQRSNTSAKYRFGIYIRDTSGSRKYRNDILNVIANNKHLDIFCPYIHDKGTVPESSESANIDWKHHNFFNIQVVAETIFDTEKIHLTEKIFKPIVMYQPFIIFAGPNSLHYLKNYGFKTFSNLWDESYDAELNSTLRFEKIIKLIEYINLLNKKDFNKLMGLAQEIINYNREHFYSEQFYNMLQNEFMENLNTALDKQEESFFTNPGGTLFYYCNKYSRNKKDANFRKFIIPGLKKTLVNVGEKSKNVQEQIIKKYPWILDY